MSANKHTILIIAVVAAAFAAMTGSAGATQVVAPSAGDDPSQIFPQPAYETQPQQPRPAEPQPSTGASQCPANNVAVAPNPLQQTVDDTKQRIKKKIERRKRAIERRKRAIKRIEQALKGEKDEEVRDGLEEMKDALDEEIENIEDDIKLLQEILDSLSD